MLILLEIRTSMVIYTDMNTDINVNINITTAITSPVQIELPTQIRILNFI